MPENEMKPCPFCGETEKIGINRRGEDWVSCRACYAEGPAKVDPESALSAWNARAPAQFAGGGEIDFMETVAVYLDDLEANMLRNDVDMLLDKNEAPSSVAERIRARAVLTDTAREGE